MATMQQPRETFVPRAGKVYAQADYEQLELHTWAQRCIDLFGFSDLADVLNSGNDAHTEMAAQILEIPQDVARARRKLGTADKDFDRTRTIAKNTNFGLPGGLGITRFCEMVRIASKNKIIIDKVQGKKIKDAWLKRWREAPMYLRWISEKTKNGNTTLVDPYTGRVRGDVGYSDGANDGFQALGAAVAKRAMWLVSKACYAQPESVLYGSRIVAFIHDEIILETDDTPKAHDVAKELERLMIAAADEYCPKVKCKAPPVLMRYWSKGAHAVYDANGRLVPWSAA